jgi:hypothetical protein
MVEKSSYLDDGLHHAIEKRPILPTVAHELHNPEMRTDVGRNAAGLANRLREETPVLA